jgi:hypothetical protein
LTFEDKFSPPEDIRQTAYTRRTTLTTILNAFASLDPHTAHAIARDLARDEELSVFVRYVGTCISKGKNPEQPDEPEPLKRCLPLDLYFGDALRDAERLSDEVEPYATIRAVILAEHQHMLDTNPTYRQHLELVAAAQASR